MKNILIVNLKRHGDIIQMSHLVSSLHENDPSSKISLLVFDEFRKSANIINHVNKIHTIPRNKIISFHKNDIYSDAWGLNQLSKSLNEINSVNWDQVINYSNDRSSSYITSYIKFNQDRVNTTGTSFNLENNAINTNEWETIYNNTADTIANACFNINDLTHLMCDLSQTSSDNKLKTNTNHNKTAFQNFNQIRNINQNKSNDVKIVGVQLKSSATSKDIPEEVLIETIRILHESSNTIPILLHSPSDEEKEYTNRINDHFSKKLITVESDIIALPSVLLNIDLVITPDTLTKHMADTTDTPVIEISLGASPFLLQGSINTKSLIISMNPKLRTYDSRETLSKDLHNSLTNTIKECIFFQTDIGSNLDIESPWAVFQPAKDQLGTTLMPIAGEVDDHMEFTRFFGRGIISKILKETDFKIEQFNDLNNSRLIDWVDEQKEVFTHVSRTLLNTIRALHQMKADKSVSKTFVECLDKLFELTKNDSMVRIPLLIFKSKLESLSSLNKEQGIKEVNELLFNLKNEIQLIVNELNKVGMDEEIAELQRTGLGESNA